MTVFTLPVGISAYEADPSDIHVATIPQCATTRRHRVPIRISCAHSGSFSKKLEGRARSFDRPLFKTIFNKNHAFPLKTEPYVDDGTHDGFPSRGRDKKYFRIILRKYGLTGWGLTQPRHHSSIGTRFPFFICRLGGLLVLILARAASVVVLRRLFLVGVVSGLVRHALTPRRVMRHHQNLLLQKWFQTNLWANICSRDLSLLISPKASKANSEWAVGHPLGSNKDEPALQALGDGMVPPQSNVRPACPIRSPLVLENLQTPYDNAQTSSPQKKAG